MDIPSFKAKHFSMNRLLFIACIILFSSKSAGKPPSAIDSPFITVDNIRFRQGNQDFFYAGTNTYYLMAYAADKDLRKFVDEILIETTNMGLKVIRTWAFNDGENQWNALQTAPGIYQEYVFQGLDYVLHKADSLGLYVILPLVNNWDDYGGMNQYVKWSPTANSHNAFYTDVSTRQWYKDHASAVLNRVNHFNGKVYKDDPTIFAWELANEARAEGDQSGKILNEWIAEMSAYIKSIDENHLVTTGIEGFYSESGGSNWMRNGWTGTDFIQNHKIAAIDFATVHVWSEHWNLDYAQSMNWIKENINDAHALIGKPVIVEEFGKKRDAGGTTTTRDKFFQGVYDLVYDSRAGGSNFWILYHDSYPDYDEFGVYFPGDSSTVRIIAAEAEKINALTPTSSKTHHQKKSPGMNIENYPNPFNAQTVIRYKIPAANARVSLRIYNLLGETVRTLIDETRTGGMLEIVWDGKDDAGNLLTSGVYISKLGISNFFACNKLILLR
ncbi:glycoside hydrolase [candidate division KSB1 bacterium]|nr:glycoside hydrolase [candidate division KSB1 bacterium]